ncbi:MAG: hypothetical protein AOY29_03750 [Alcanivorax borkumensis]|nr:hypothetical protein [Alcanivorax borkumensis]OJH07371.1 MAG: hypothetical protein AOY29_03750 [Alcanivorax borkumensis]
MTWSEGYWDIINELYWVPSYLGLKSIPKRHWTVEGNMVCVPKSMTNPSGPLYRRVRSGDDYEAFIRRQEETFNHILNLTLSILPGEVVAEIFGPVANFSVPGDLKVLGKSISNRYSWIAGANATTPDAFLLSESCIFAIEIKFNAKTSLDQLAKYVALIAGEEIQNGKRDFVNLLFVYPLKANEKFISQTNINPVDIGPRYFDMLSDSVGNARVKSLYLSEQESIRDTLSRLNVRCITWQDLYGQIISFMEKLGESNGDKTLFRLLSGLASEILFHPLSCVDEKA